MRLIHPQNANSTKVSVTTTSKALNTLMDTAGGSDSAGYYAKKGAGILILTVESGNIRCLQGGTPTTAKGLLLSEGGYYQIPVGDITNFNLISTLGTATASVHLARAHDEQGFVVGGAGSGGGGSTPAAGSVGGTTGEYSNAKGDFVATPTDGAKTITIAGLSFTLETKHVVSGGLIQKIDTSGNVTDLDMDNVAVSGNVITLANIDDFVSTDSVVVNLENQNKAYEQGSNLINFAERRPLDQKYLNNPLVDTTNVSAATHYYPSATGGTMDGFQDQSMTGKFIDADGTLTLTLEVSNDEDSTNADWNGAYFYDDELNATVASKTVTNGTELFTLSCNNNNFRRYRWVVVANGATNTVILKERKKAL